VSIVVQRMKILEYFANVVIYTNLGRAILGVLSFVCWQKEEKRMGSSSWIWKNQIL